MVNLTRLFAGILAIACTATSATAQEKAEDYPSGTIRIVIGFSPGGGSDVSGRVIADKLSAKWGKPVIVENRPGAQGNLAMALVAKAPADGYTLAIVPVGNAAVNPSLFRELPYDMKEFAPVSQIAVVENVLVINAKSPARSLKEFVALGKKDARFTFSSPGAGSQGHLAAELLARATGIEILHIPYKGLGPALQDVLSGEITMTFAQLSNAKQFIENGQLRALGVASLKRSAALPDVPTIAEAGDLPGFEALSWYALMAPAHTPPAIIAKLSEEVSRIVKLPDVADALAAQGAQAVGGTPQELANIITADTARWAKVIKDAGIPQQ